MTMTLRGILNLFLGIAKWFEKNLEAESFALTST